MVFEPVRVGLGIREDTIGSHYPLLVTEGGWSLKDSKDPSNHLNQISNTLLSDLIIPQFSSIKVLRKSCVQSQTQNSLG